MEPVPEQAHAHDEGGARVLSEVAFEVAKLTAKGEVENTLALPLSCFGFIA